MEKVKLNLKDLAEFVSKEIGLNYVKIKIVKFDDFNLPTKFETLYNAYEKPSIYKINAYDSCYNIVYNAMMKNYSIIKYGVIGHNCMQFSYGFIFGAYGQEFFLKITKDNFYLFVLVD